MEINIEQTPYETGPVESLSEALLAFVEAYDKLQVVISDAIESEILEVGQERYFARFRDTLKLTMYGPVSPQGESRASLSLYEIGVVYFPGAHKYSIHKGKLEKALRVRGDDIQSLFVQSDGLLPRLCEMLPEFLEYEPPEKVYTAALRFLNECRRLTAMWV